MEMNYSIVNLELPDWMIDIPQQEYFSIMNTCRQAAVSAFYRKLDSIYEQVKIREAAKAVGQLSIDDYV